ncbi:MAG TPA: hypothetical protein VN457_01375 [Chlamydiales bacterium]|nr:hypothetical protein [Chlamydiales bacterium]
MSILYTTRIGQNAVENSIIDTYVATWQEKARILYADARHSDARRLIPQNKQLTAEFHAKFQSASKMLLLQPFKNFPHETYIALDESLRLQGIVRVVTINDKPYFSNLITNPDNLLSSKNAVKGIATALGRHCIADSIASKHEGNIRCIPDNKYLTEWYLKLGFKVAEKDDVDPSMRHAAKQRSPHFNEPLLYLPPSTAQQFVKRLSTANVCTLKQPAHLFWIAKEIGIRNLLTKFAWPKMKHAVVTTTHQIKVAGTTTLQTIATTYQKFVDTVFGPKSLLPQGGRIGSKNGVITTYDKEYIIYKLGLDVVNVIINRYRHRRDKIVLYTCQEALDYLRYSDLLRIEDIYLEHTGLVKRFRVPIDHLVTAVEKYRPLEIRNEGRCLVLQDTPDKARWLEYKKVNENGAHEYVVMEKENPNSSKVHVHAEHKKVEPKKAERIPTKEDASKIRCATINFSKKYKALPQTSSNPVETVPPALLEAAKAQFSVIAVRDEGRYLLLEESAKKTKWLQWTRIGDSCKYLILELSRA